MSDTQAIKEALIIFDFLSYKEKTSKAPLRADTKTSAGTKGMILDAIPGWAGLSAADKAAFNAYKARLTDHESNRDLKIVLSEVMSNGSVSDKVKVKEALIIFDFLSYKEKTSKSPLRADTKTSAGTKGMILDAIPGWAGLSAADKAAFNAYKARLTDHESNRDLKTVLCELNPSESFCPTIRQITSGGSPIAQLQEGQEIPIVIEGANFPADAQVEFLTGTPPAVSNGIERVTTSAFTVLPDGTKVNLTIKANTAGSYQVKVHSQAVPNLSAVASLTVTPGNVTVFTVTPGDIPTINTTISEIKITGMNLQRVEGLRLPTSGPFADTRFNIDTVNSTADTVIFKFVTPVSITEKTPPAKYTFNLLGKRNAVLAGGTFEIEIVAPEKKPAPSWLRGLISGSEVTLASTPLASGDLPKPAGAEQDKTHPDLRFGLRLNPKIIGKEDTMIKDDKLDVQAHAQGELGWGEGTNLKNGQLGASGAYEFHPLLKPEVYGRVGREDNDYPDPSRQFPSGKRDEAAGGLALNSEFEKVLGIKPSTRLYAECVRSWLQDEETFGDPFTSEDNRVKAGGDLKLQVSDGIAITAGGRLPVYGTHTVPERAFVNGRKLMDTSSAEAVRGYDLHARLDWGPVSVFGGYEYERIANWPSTNHTNFGAEYRDRDAGNFRLQIDRGNSNPYYPTKKPYGIELSWTEPWLGIFSARVEYDRLHDRKTGRDMDNLNLSLNINLDRAILKAFGYEVE